MLQQLFTSLHVCPWANATAVTYPVYMYVLWVMLQQLLPQSTCTVSPLGNATAVTSPVYMYSKSFG